ncbi:hypothetical protein GRJ2_002808100 [Grus japonensis]|uniref:Reverse transcriptase domain-containing protein n=1 Tax=Grus japonensis TaxID=30415 RepID=A0ABC9Y083_GRUJA
MATWDKPDLDCSPLLDLLKSYKACPTPKGYNWAEGHWQPLTTVVEQIRDLAKENKFKPGKGKAVVCGVLGAALISDQKDKYIVKQAEWEANESLQELMRKLQAELEMEQVKQQLAKKALANDKRIMENLKGSLRDAFVRERELKLQLPGDLESEPGLSSLSKEADLITREVAPHYPWEELGAVTEPDPTPKLRPLIKTEVVYDGKEAEPAVTTEEIPYTVTELAKLQALNADTTGRSGIVPDKKQIWVTDVFGYSKPQPTARVKCWLLADTTPTETTMEQSHKILATIDVKDMFFMVPLQEGDRDRFAFTWEGGSNPLFTSTKGNIPAGNVTFDKYTRTYSCHRYPWDPLFDPLAKPDFYEANYSTHSTGPRMAYPTPE